MRERALQIGQYAGDVTQVLRLAVAPVEPGKNTENLGRPLRRQRCVELREDGSVKALVGAAARGRSG